MVVSSTAARATKLWSSTDYGSVRFLVHLLHVTCHLGVDRLASVVEHRLMENLPSALTAAAIRAHSPVCPACIRGKSKYLGRDHVDVGAAVLRDPPQKSSLTKNPAFGHNEKVKSLGGGMIFHCFFK